jgi:VanZ family protein
MIKRPPKGKQWLSWLYVVVWSLCIFSVIPIARLIQQYVYQTWGRDLFTYGVIFVTIMAFAVAVVYVYRNRLDTRSSYLWLIVVASIVFAYTLDLGKQQPEESVHFILFGMLGVLVYRALTHRLKDSSIFLAGAIICGCIGIIDEFIQWMTPRRLWDLRDIGLNLISAILVQVAIAKGLRPAFILQGVSRKNLQFMCSLIIVATALLGGSLLMTPLRIVWISERIGFLEFLKHNDSVMLEYGYRYEDPEVGVFRSRFKSHELKQIDRIRAVEAAKILNKFQDEKLYPLFLSVCTPITDPFVHEARVHLFRRDRYLDNALKIGDNSKWYAPGLTIALRENLIMEKYFHNTLKQSNYIWTEEQSALARKHFLHDKFDDSLVSLALITRVSEQQVAGFFMILMLGLLLFRWYLGKDR